MPSVSPRSRPQLAAIGRGIIAGILDDIGLNERSPSAPAPEGYGRVRDRLKRGLARYPTLYREFRRAASAVRRVGRDLRFRSWSAWSRGRYGDTRWITVYEGPRILVRTDDYRAFGVALRRGSQRDQVALWCETARLGPAVCIDVGANYGEFTAAVAARGIPTLAIEANPTLVECLRRSFADQPHVLVVHAAACDRDGTASFFVNQESSGASSMSEGWAPAILGRGERPEEVVVPARRLDTLVLELLGRQPESVLLKVDVEGFEEEVLRGATELLGKARWWRAVLEYGGDILKTRGDEQLWDAWRRHPGFVIGSEGGPVGDELLERRLPETPPGPNCNIFVGEGHVEIRDERP